MILKVASSSLLFLMFALTEVAAAQTADGTPLLAPLDSDGMAVASIVMGAVSDVKLCTLALEKSQNADLQKMCRKATSDNAQTAIAGMQLAQKIGATSVKLQESPDIPALLDTLTHYSGYEFDRAFLLAKIEDDAGDEQRVRYALEFADDSSVKRYEKSVLPKIEQQLERAESALRKVSEDNP